VGCEEEWAPEEEEYRQKTRSDGKTTTKKNVVSRIERER
jgi:hypothetical protein